MGFREDIEADNIGVFLFSDEFAEPVDVEGRGLRAVIDERERGERDYEMGLPSDGMTLYARSCDLPARRAPGSALIVDGVSYMVEAWREDMGMAQVSLIRAM